ncbi:TPA: peptidase [Pasteurella multocida]|uniref:peptidase n=1 Tax=Pasteurella multocida TaxID=747 RepID=UPI00202274AF|nr:peptidase [Pasteurella multocida]MCL7759238.1 peptidase [Pasteurella multocida]MCL7787724.1 peptidase [Pasteurella multocida]HDR1289578.1 peptidase [Pasteurella multocida]HDR1333286.1 peptidase [Pasteurella multocida]HDR1815854.1 peptidase [Pasteurella multocida]
MELIEIFKAGKRVDANGKIVEITTDDLQQAVEAYDPAFHESPVVIGHPKDNHPAYAWVKSLQLEGDILKAELSQVDPEFAEMVEKGRYKKVSASFYLANSQANPKQGSLYLRHVGFLGAVPPAVKGLRNPEFAEGEEGVVDFSDWTEATLWRRLRDWFIGKHGQDEADKVLPDYLVGSVQEEAVRNSLQPQKAESPIFNEPTQPQGEPEMSEQDKAELERLKAENQQLKDEKAQAEAQKAEAQLNQTKADNADFAESLVSAGKLAPVAKEKAIELLNCAAVQSAGGVVEFGEGENMLTIIKAFLSDQPQIIQFAEVATKDNATTAEDNTVEYAEGTSAEAIDMDKRVRAYMKEHNVSYVTAFNAIHS